MIKTNSFLFALALLMCCLGISMAVPKSNYSDEEALLTFKAHISSDPFHIITSNWSSSSSFCYWIGVTCSKRHQRVASLNLPYMNLEGTISPHIANLSFLVSIDLTNNSFHGELPNELGNLRRLKSMDLTNNNFNGNIPSTFGNLPVLEAMILRNNDLTGTIPSSLFNIPTLVILNLQGNFLHGNIPQEIGGHLNLKELWLGYNKLSGEVPLVLFNISSLRIISLPSNNFSDSLGENLCSHNSKNLEWLDLSVNQLYGPIPSNLYKCNALRILGLAVNNFTGSIPKEIGNITNLEKLLFGANYLSGVIPREVGYLTKLETLVFESNNLVGTIPREIGVLSKLKTLRLSKNQLSGVLPETFCNNHSNNHLQVLQINHNDMFGSVLPILSLCKSLTEVIIQKNKFTGNIPEEIGNLTRLEVLAMDENNFKGVIPSKVFNISTLHALSLVGNFFSDQLPVTMGLSVLSLQYLYLGLNQLNGTIPTSICNFSQMILLDMGINFLSGSIPDCFGNFRRLKILSLNFNNLTSKNSNLLSSLASCHHLEKIHLTNNPNLNINLPISLGNLSSLKMIDAKNCGVTGNIPSEITNLTNLIRLEMSYNQLDGIIPNSIGRLENLQGWFVSSNELEGAIPLEICDLKNLAYLFLDENNLFGSIPSCVENLTSLRNLNLKSNKFVSEIPYSLWSLKDMLELDLSSNSLSGYIPLAISNLKTLTVLNLSKNHLSGDIPSSIGGLQNLQILRLSENMLQGHIPQSVEYLSDLYFLDFSSNNLSGVIPKSIVKLTKLEYFNVSFNQLEGEIPNGGSFTNFSAQSFEGNEKLCSSNKMGIPLCVGNNLQSKKGTKFVLKCILPIVASLILIALASSMLCTRKRRRNEKNEQESPFVNMRKISYYELERATSGFQEYNLLGVGSFGSVYKGTLLDGTICAIKVFNLQLEEAFKSFEVECQVLRNLHHRNLVKVLTSCCSDDFKALVMEFMSNWSLEKWLYSHNYFLNFLQRLNIMLDVASALKYLHHDYDLPIVHCDIKPSNVLLDEDLVAHVSDFGITKLLAEGNSFTHTMTLATIGYMAPEYGSRGIISVKNDVYSYGILLMETFTRKKPTDEVFTGELSLKHWVEQFVPHGVSQIIDANLVSGDEEKNCEAKKNGIISIFDLALQCSTELPDKRISMKDVVVSLNKIKKQFLKHEDQSSRRH